MTLPDLNMLVTLDVLLAEGSVTGAARRLRLSPSAMSRALARLRETLGDPLLVRAGRGLVPTPRALELRDRVGQLVQGAESVLRPAERLDPMRLVRTFTLRTSDGFVESFGPELIARVGKQAKGVTLRFVVKADKVSGPLRTGAVDLETGVVDEATSPELRTQALFRDRLIGVVHRRHSLSRGKVTAARYAGGRHVVFSRRSDAREPIDEILDRLGLTREVPAVVGGFATAIALARATDLVATVPEHHTRSLRGDLYSFALPFSAPKFTVSMLWHPRLDADPAHRWLREQVREVVAGEAPKKKRAS